MILDPVAEILNEEGKRAEITLNPEQRIAILIISGSLLIGTSVPFGSYYYNRNWETPEEAWKKHMVKHPEDEKAETKMVIRGSSPHEDASRLRHLPAF